MQRGSGSQQGWGRSTTGGCGGAGQHLEEDAPQPRMQGLTEGAFHSPGATGDLHPRWEERDGQGAQPRVLVKLHGAKSPGSGAGFDRVIVVVRLRGLSERVAFSLVGLHRHLDSPILAQIAEQNPRAHKGLSLSISAVPLAN